MASNTPRRYFGVKTKWAWSRDTTLLPLLNSGDSLLGGRETNVIEDEVTPIRQDGTVSKIVAPVKLIPDRQRAADLMATLRACNAAANHVSDVAWDRRIFRNFALRSVTYGDVRSRFGLGAQAAQHTIKKVADAYNSGRPEHRRTRRRTFRWGAAQPFDARNLS